jgi:hypothetical protein
MGYASAAAPVRSLASSDCRQLTRAGAAEVERASEPAVFFRLPPPAPGARADSPADECLFPRVLSVAFAAFRPFPSLRSNGPSEGI